VRQSNVLPETHRLRLQTLWPTRTVGELSGPPKFVPSNVTVTPAFAGPFETDEDVTTGASKLNTLSIVPDCTPCFNETAISLPVPGATTHWTWLLATKVV